MKKELCVKLVIYKNSLPSSLLEFPTILNMNNNFKIILHKTSHNMSS